MAFRNDQQPTALCNQIMAGENHSGTIAAVVEDLCFHAVKTKLDRHVNGFRFDLQNILQLLNGKRGNIACAADGHGDATDPPAIGMETLIDQLSNVTENGIIRGGKKPRPYP